MKAYPRTRCLVPDCQHKAHCRGLCHNHYNQATMSVRFKQTTWEELIKHGKCTAVVQKRRNRKWLLDFQKGNHD